MGVKRLLFNINKVLSIRYGIGPGHHSLAPATSPRVVAIRAPSALLYEGRVGIRRTSGHTNGLPTAAGNSSAVRDRPPRTPPGSLLKYPALFGCMLLVATNAWADFARPVDSGTVTTSADSAINTQHPPGNGPLRLTLREALQLALARNPSLRNAYLGRVVDRANLDLANQTFHPRSSVVFRTGEQRAAGADGLRARTASVNPEVGLALPTGAQANLNWRAERVLQSTAAPTETEDSTHELTLNITQPLLRGGGLEVGRAPVERALLNEEQNALALEAQITGTLISVIQAYHTLILEIQRGELAELALERDQRQLANRTELVERGRVAATDLASARESLARQELQREQTRERREQAELELNRLIGLAPGVGIEPQDTIDVDSIGGLKADPPALARALEVALERRPEFRQSLVGQRLAALARTLAEDAELWQLDLVASIEVQGDGRSTSRAFERGFEQAPGHAVGLRISTTWGDRPAREQRLGAARVQQRQARLRTQELRTSIRIEVQRSLDALDSRWDQLSLAEQALVLARQAVAVEQEKLAVGRSSGFEVEGVERDLRQAEQSLLDAAINYQNARTDLDQAMGIVLERWELAIPSRKIGPPARSD